MRTHIKKWGNSLAVRIPKSIADRLEFTSDREVELRVVEDQLIISPVHESEFSLIELLERIKPENLHGEIDFGSAEGHEVW